MRPTEVNEVDVYCRQKLVGRIVRTNNGSEFHCLESAGEKPPTRVGVAFSIPPSRKRVVTHGINLHPFFAGLLPEGLRLSSLTRRTKTSADDLLSLLVAVGSDCIGDIAVVPKGSELPEVKGLIDVAKIHENDFEEILQASLETTSTSLTDVSIPGVQEKISGYMISFPVGAKSQQASYILKLNPTDRPLLVENEEYFLRMAKDCGLKVTQAKLMHDQNGVAGLLVTRFDRLFGEGTTTPAKVHQEDACQFLDRYPADKYRITCREIAEGILEFAHAPLVEILKFLELYAFSYIIGNGDLHAKNVSLWVSPTTRLVELTPAYDLLTTQAYRGLDQRMAMKLGAKDDEFLRQDFVNFGARFGVRETPIVKMLGSNLSTRSEMDQQARNSRLGRGGQKPYRQMHRIKMQTPSGIVRENSYRRTALAQGQRVNDLRVDD